MAASVDGDPSRKKKKKRSVFRLFGKKRKNKSATSSSLSSSSSPAMLLAPTTANGQAGAAVGNGMVTKTSSGSSALRMEAPSNKPSSNHNNYQAKTNKGTNNTTDTDISDGISSMKPNWLSKTRFFKDMIDSAFALVDQDGSNSIDEKELYSGLLLIHLKMGSYAGPAACKPISREKCHAVFMKMDVDGSGHLDKEEFEAVMMVLFGNVLLRVAIQYACTLLVVPMIAQYLLSGLLGLWFYLYLAVVTLDEHFEVANMIELMIEHLWSHAIHFWSQYIPTVVSNALDTIQAALDKVPESVWNTMPLTLLSTVLSLMLIPWSLLQIDDFFQRLADKTKSNNKAAASRTAASTNTTATKK